jgi:hypothetical protein
MTDEQDGQPRQPHRRPVDGPTVMGPSTGHLHGPAAPATRQDEPTSTTPASTGPADAQPEEATLADPTSPTNRPTGPANARPDEAAAGPDNPAATAPDEPTVASPAPGSTAPGAAAPVEDAAQAPPSSTWSSDPIDKPSPTTPWPGTPPVETTLADPGRPPAGVDDPSDGPTLATPRPTAPVGHPAPDEPTLATPAPRPPGPAEDATLVVPAPTWSDGPTVATPVHEVTIPAGDPDDPTTAVVDESPTTTGPTVAGWPLDELLPAPPTDLVWRPDVPEPPPPSRRPAYYVALGAAVVLVVALIAAAALVTVVRPNREVAGAARPTQAVPDITGSAPPTSAPPPAPRPGPADHPLSTSPARMADATCALPRFDLADDRQAAFYAAAKVCADSAWRGVLEEAGLRATVEVVTVTGPVRTRSCGEIAPGSPSAQCDGTVYMTPAHLRDTERNGRYPGRYFGVFLREYARALQFTTGLSESAPATEDGETRLLQQAICLAGIASGSMADRGAVDANITGEISARLSSVDAPPDAKAMLDKGFQERTLRSCNAW